MQVCPALHKGALCGDALRWVTQFWKVSCGRENGICTGFPRVPTETPFSIGNVGFRGGLGEADLE